MPRLVRHVVPALSPMLIALALVAAGPGASIGAGGPGQASRNVAQPMAVVDWPVSTGLVVGEVMTGGASASDEYVELYNAGQSIVDIGGLELVYATSTGGTITRKATWPSPTLLAPARHLLVANGSGSFATMADAQYSGGLSGTGGAMAVRVIGGATIDAVGWGDAVSAFVEGSAAPAPPAGSSIERRPGGNLGNGTDGNDNLSDWLINGAPTAQNVASPPSNGGPTPSPTPTLAPTPSPSPTPTARP
ncbi:MAG: lamin tail domain-containing protein, partial [Candidatus Limnocylindrales bacterium]